MEQIICANPMKYYICAINIVFSGSLQGGLQGPADDRDVQIIIELSIISESK